MKETAVSSLSHNRPGITRQLSELPQKAGMLAYEACILPIHFVSTDIVPILAQQIKKLYLV